MNDPTEQVVDTAADEQQPAVVDPSATTDPDSDHLKEAERGIEKALKDTKAELTRVQQERAEERRLLEEKIAKLEGMVSAIATQRKEVEQKQDLPDPFEFLDSQDFTEKFYEDVNVPRQALKKMIDVFGRVIMARDAEMERRLERQKAELLTLVNRPDPVLAEKIAELRKDPELAALNDDALAVIARKFSSAKRGEQKEFPGVPIDSGRPPSSGRGDPMLEKLTAIKMKEIYGDV